MNSFYNLNPSMNEPVIGRDAASRLQQFIHVICDEMTIHTVVDSDTDSKKLRDQKSSATTHEISTTGSRHRDAVQWFISDLLK